MKKLIIALLCFTIVVATTAWFFLRNNDKALNVLPADATVVAVFEPTKLADGLGLDMHDVMKLASSFADVEGAIDFSNPFYAFTTEKGITGLVLNVKDVDKLLKSILAFGFAGEKQQGLNWVANDNIICCIDDDKMLLCIASVTQQNALRGEMMKLMKQTRQEVPILKKANKQTGFLKLSAALSSLPKSQMPPGYDHSGAFLTASAAIGKQDITLSANVEDKDGKPYNGRVKGKELLCPIDGLLPTIRSANPFAWLCMGIKGEQLLNILRSKPQVSTSLMALNVAFFDADQILKAIDGDVMIMMPKAGEMLFTAKISNSNFLKDANEWDTTSSIDGMSLRKRGLNDDYVFTFNDKHLYFGVRGGLLYVASSEQVATLFLQESETDVLYNNIAGRYVIGSLDVNQLIGNNTLITILLSAVPAFSENIKAIDKINMACKTPQSLELSIQTKKPIKDIMSSLWTVLTD